MAESCSRYEDAAAVLAVICEHESSAGQLLSHACRHLLSSSFKNVFTSCRGALKMLSLVGEHEHHPLRRAAVGMYTSRMEGEMLRICHSVLHLVTDLQLPVAEELLSTAAACDRRDVLEAVVFYFKLSADYCRYVAECHTDASVVAQFSDRALSYYSKARSYAVMGMRRDAPALLGVTLNFTVFLFEIRTGCGVEAYDMARDALRDAIAARSSGDDASAGTGGIVPQLTGEERGESDAVCALLRENIRTWAQVLQVAAIR